MGTHLAIQEKRGVVTGGAGFIGSTLIDRLLAGGWDVLAVDDLSTGRIENLDAARRSPDFHLEVMDIRSARLREVFLAYGPSIIFHLAAQASVAVSVREPATDADVNVVGSLRVFDAAREAGARKIVFAASGGTLYGDVGPASLPIDESFPHHPQSPYGLAKKSVVDYLALYADLYGLDYTALALANVYGPRQDPHGEAGVVAIFAEEMCSGRPCRIDGDGNQTRDFVYVDDVARAFVLAADRASRCLLNIGTGVQVSINHLHSTLAAVAGSSVDPQHGDARRSDVRFSSLDPALAADRLDWRPDVELSDGLERTIRSGAIPSVRC